MAKLFDPRKLLKEISNSLLQEFFRRRGELLDVTWLQLQETDVDAPFEAWQALPDGARKEVQVILQDLAELSGERGLMVIAEEISRRCPKRADEVTALSGRLDKAMWFYLNLPKAFEEVALFASADAMSVGRYAVRRGGLPMGPFKVTRRMTAAIQDALRNYYWPTEMRGQYCKVHHYSRPGHGEYFFSYLDDWPDKSQIFDNHGAMKVQAARYAFFTVFVYCPADGSLEVIAQGGDDVHLALQQAFCKAAFGIEVGPTDPLRPAYKLDMLLNPSFAYPTNPADRIKVARLSRIRVTPLSNSRELDYLELKFPPRVTREQWLKIISRALECHNLSPAQVVVKQASFQLVFMANDQGREQKMTFNVSIPKTCDLKTRPDEPQIRGQHCLKLWGIIND